MQTQLKARFDYLEALKAEARDYFSSYSEEALNKPPQPGKWGALQHMAHILSSESKGLSYMSKKIQGADGMGRAGFREKTMGFLLDAFLKTGIKFKAPAVLDVPAAHYTVDELFTEWDRLRNRYETFLEPMNERMAHTLIYKHPVAGRLSPVQALGFMGTHLHRHLSAAKKALR